MSKPHRSHIIGKVYDITKENVNKLIKELDEYHSYADKLELEVNNNYEMYRDARYAYNARKKQLGELQGDYDRLEERFYACLNSDEFNEKRVKELEQLIIELIYRTSYCNFPEYFYDRAKMLGLDKIDYDNLINRSVEKLEKRLEKK